MAILTLVFPPGSVATITKSGNQWIVQSVNTVEVVLQIDDTDNDGFISDAEWNAAVGGGNGTDIGSADYLYSGSGTSGTIYSADGVTTFTVGQNVGPIRAAMSNAFQLDVSAIDCFTSGTNIETVNGQVKIDDLVVGDQVVTRTNGLQKIRWIGRRRVKKSNLMARPNLLPVRITAGALGCGLPERDLLVSRQHRMLIRSRIAERMFGSAEVLIPAIKLTTLPGIFVEENPDDMIYFHLLFDQHEVIYAEGAPAESFFIGPEGWKALPEESREEILTLFPELADQKHISEPSCLIPEGKQQKQLIARHEKNNKPLLMTE